MTSFAKPLANTVVGSECLDGDVKIAQVVPIKDWLLEMSSFLMPSPSYSGRTLVTVRLICPDEVLIVLIRTFGITGLVSVLEAGEPLLLSSLVILEGLSGCFDSNFFATSCSMSCSYIFLGVPGLSLASFWGLTSLDSFCNVKEFKSSESVVSAFLALRAAMAAIHEESLAEDLFVFGEVLDKVTDPGASSFLCSFCSSGFGTAFFVSASVFSMGKLLK